MKKIVLLIVAEIFICSILFAADKLISQQKIDDIKMCSMNARLNMVMGDYDKALKWFDDLDEILKSYEEKKPTMNEKIVLLEEQIEVLKAEIAKLKAPKKWGK